MGLLSFLKGETRSMTCKTVGCGHERAEHRLDPHHHYYKYCTHRPCHCSFFKGKQPSDAERYASTPSTRPLNASTYVPEKEIPDNEKIKRLLAGSLPTGWSHGHCAGCNKSFQSFGYTIAGRTGLPCWVSCNSLLNTSR